MSRQCHPFSLSGSEVRGCVLLSEDEARGYAAYALTSNMPQRRFPPWSVEELDACFVATDSTGQKLAYVYFEDEPGRRSAAKLLSEKA